MNLFNNRTQKRILKTFAVMSLAIGFASCSTDDNDDDDMDPMLDSATFNYEFHNGQTVPTAAYAGPHPGNFSADVTLDENADGTTTISVTLNNTVDGQMYPIHVHDAADPATTPNGTPYNETPNSEVFVQMAQGNGESVTVTQTSSLSYDELTSTYGGFFVVHDPLQDISTTDISTYLVVSSFAREQAPSGLVSESFSYDFNTGQISPDFTYAGTHPDNLGATITVQELADGTARVSVALDNTVDGEMYMIHAHDVADPATTPNGTPYNETPNGNVLATSTMGNGGTAYAGQLSTSSLADLTTSYEAFFVVHDPLQAISTTDPTTYVILGSFAR